MTNNSKKKLYDISYSIEIDSSTYYVLGQRMKYPKYSSTYFLAENAAVRPKSAIISTTSPTRIQRSKSPKRTDSLVRRSKTTHDRKLISNSDIFTNQQQKSNQTYHRRYTSSKSKNFNHTPDKTIKNEQKSSTKSIQSKRKESSTEVKTNNQQQEILRLFHEQKRSLSQLFEQHIRKITTPSIDVIQQTISETLKSQQYKLTKEIEHSLIQTIQQELQKTLPKTNDKSQTNSLDANTIRRLQDIFIQAIEKYIASTEKDHNITLNRLFTEQKQVLIETLSQQQSTSSIKLIKQAVTDALSEHNSTSISPNIPTNQKAKPKIINPEIKITANLKQTRVDAAFRQQRDSIVANRYFRDTVRQWSNIRSISSLIKKVQEYSTNDLENAWLIYCWIGQNIQYDNSCENHTAESVFENRIGACRGFVNLYHECCSLLNIQCSQISGYIKQNFLKKNENLTNYSHSWNAFIFDEYSYLIDPTWGAGGSDNSNEFQDFYFVISSEEFIYTHYSNGHQFLEPEITKQEFISLPVVTSNYYRLNLNLLSPKQGYNQTNENIFQISIKTPAYVDLFVSLKIDNIEYPRHLHTFCQRDINQIDRINCFLAPPTDGFYEIIVYAKTNNETTYRDTIYMKLNVLNLIQTITFPIIHKLFIEYKCILIEPFRRLLQGNECITISMIIPNAKIVKIKNGDDFIVPNKDEYQNGLLKKDIYVQGDIYICARWDDRTDQISTICVFNMI